MKKCVIIGSGLGGLTCGVVLAKNGYKVTVVEKELQAGGCLQCFMRRGVKFETGMHFIGSAAPDQTLGKLFRYLEIDEKVQLSELDTNGYDVVHLNGRDYRIANGRQQFIDTLAADFPDQRKNLEQYYDLIERVASASSLHSLKYAESDSTVSAEYQMRSINEVVESIITDPTLAKVLVGNLPLYAAERDKTPFSTHAFITDFYNQSAYRIVGGSDNVARALIDTIERYGGQVLTRSEATHIVCDETHATGVEINKSDVLEADVVISDAHPMRTLELIDSHLIRPAYRRRINAIPQTAGGFTVNLHFREQTMPYMNHNFYAYNYGTPWDCERYDEQTWPKGYLYMHFCNEQHQQWAKGGVILSYMQMDEVERWRGTKVGRRGEDYEEFKRRKAEQLIDSLEQHMPGLRDKIEHYYTATPLTYLDYTGTEGGGMYGVAKDIHKSADYRVSHRLKIPNVLQTGQNINSHGMLGVMVGTIVTCSELLTAKEIYSQIIKANER